MTDDRPLVPLSETELAILKLVATGATNREIARERSISEATVKKHLTNINGKLETSNRTEAVRRALDQGLISLGSPEEGARDPRAQEAERQQQREAARRLAEELERARRRTRQVVRLFGIGALALVLVFGFLLWQLRDGLVSPPPVTPEPAPTGVAAREAQWLPGGRLPSPRDGLALVQAKGLYAIGGEDDEGLLGDMLRYRRGIVQEWERLADKPTPVRDISAVAVQGFIVVPGGCDGSGAATAVVEIYDTENGAWTEGPGLPEPVCDYALAYVPGRIYLFGGRSSAALESATDAVWSYRLGDESWQAERKMARPRSGLAAAVIDDQVHVIGGFDEGGRAQVNHWVFRPDGSPEWLEDVSPDLPTPRAGHVAVGVSVLRRLYLVGGSVDRDEPSALVLDVGDGEAWLTFRAPKLQTPRRGAAADVRNDGREIWLAGGTGIEGARLNFTYVYNQTPLFDRLLDAVP